MTAIISPRYREHSYVVTFAYTDVFFSVLLSELPLPKLATP